MTHLRHRSPGFTLVEMLVAMALAIIVLGLAIYVANSSTFNSYRIVGAADRLSQWAMTAKNRALRDKAPRGIRLVQDAAGNYTECVYIESPDPWVPAPGVRLVAFLPDPGTAGLPVQDNQKRFFLTGVSLADFQSLVSTAPQADSLYVPDWGRSYRITGITAPGGPGVPVGATVQLTLQTTNAQLPDLGAAHSPDGSTPVYQTSNFVIYRQAQPLLGEPALLLQPGMAVDVAHSLNPANANGDYDILFAPNGEVLDSQAGLRVLLLRDINRDLPATGGPNAQGLWPTPITDAQTWFDQAGEMVLVCIYTRTGAVGTQPVAPPSSADAFKFAKDAINTGL